MLIRVSFGLFPERREEFPTRCGTLLQQLLVLNSDERTQLSPTHLQHQHTALCQWLVGTR